MGWIDQRLGTVFGQFSTLPQYSRGHQVVCGSSMSQANRWKRKKFYTIYRGDSRPSLFIRWNTTSRGCCCRHRLLAKLFLPVAIVVTLWSNGQEYKNIPEDFHLPTKWVLPLLFISFLFYVLTLVLCADDCMNRMKTSHSLVEEGSGQWTCGLVPDALSVTYNSDG